MSHMAPSYTLPELGASAPEFTLEGLTHPAQLLSVNSTVSSRCPAALTLRIAKDAVKGNVQNVPRLRLDGVALVREIVGEHRAVKEIAHHVGDALHRHIADTA